MLRYYSQPSTRLDTRAVLMVMAPAPEKNDLGQYPVVPTLVARVWAGVTPQTGTLLSGRPAETELSRTTHKIVIRYRKGVTPDMWFEIEGVRYDIIYVMDPYIAHETLECFCEVRVDGSPGRV